MITVYFDEFLTENTKAIQELREMGMSDKEIQEMVDRQAELDGHILRKEKDDGNNRTTNRGN